MSGFKTKMHQIRLQLGLCPRHCWEAYSAFPDPLAGGEVLAASQLPSSVWGIALAEVVAAPSPGAVLGKNIWGGLAPHHLGGNNG